MHFARSARIFVFFSKTLCISESPLRGIIIIITIIIIRSLRIPGFRVIFQGGTSSHGSQGRGSDTSNDYVFWEQRCIGHKSWFLIIQLCALYTRRGSARRPWGLGNSLRESWRRIQPGRMEIRNLREYTIPTPTGGILIIYASMGRGIPGARPARFRPGHSALPRARFPWCLPRDGMRILSAQG